ncbi:MAG: VF530 family protein [Planctomycetota bacterium]
MSDKNSKPGKNNDPLHGVTLEMMVTRLKDAYGWEELGRQVRINCFNNDPSVKSSLKFLRKTGWARDKVESFYLYSVRKKKINPDQ